MLKGQQWKPKEIELIRKLYPRYEKEKLLKLLPNRTWDAISRRAARLGIKVDRTELLKTHPYYLKSLEIGSLAERIAEAILERNGFKVYEFGQIVCKLFPPRIARTFTIGDRTYTQYTQVDGRTYTQVSRRTCTQAPKPFVIGRPSSWTRPISGAKFGIRKLKKARKFFVEMKEERFRPDFFAFKHNEVFVVEVKVDQSPLRPSQRNILLKAFEYGLTPLVVKVETSICALKKERCS